MEKRTAAMSVVIALLGLGCGQQSDNGGKIQFTASGEVLALAGYGFPPTTDEAIAFADGWEVRFDRVLVTFANITLSENPDMAPTDQSKIGKVVAGVDGPWAIDLHKGGSLLGKGGSNEQAYPLATVANQNRNGGKAFDPTVRYALGYEIIPATASATRLQFGADDADYAEMISKGWTVLFVGTATWKGSNCTSSSTSFDFKEVPEVVKFRFGFSTPAAYVNCQNPDNDPAAALGSEEHERGVQVKGNQTIQAQLTLHTDHPFWESILHDTPEHFDQIAANAKADALGNATVTLDDLLGVSYTAFAFRGMPLPWRSCLSGYTPPDASPQMGFDSRGIPSNRIGSASTSFRDYRDFMTYNASTMGHLNSDGLCFVQRKYSSPN